MAEARLSSFARMVNFVVFDANGISPAKANPLIKKMHKSLAEFKLKEGYLSAYVVVIDEFQVETKNTNLLHGQWKCRFEQVDSNEDGGATMRFNNSNERVLLNALCRLQFHKYNSIIKIVPDFNNIGELLIEDSEAIKDFKLTGEAQLIFYRRFQQAIFDHPYLAKCLTLEKEHLRLQIDRQIDAKTKAELIKNIERLLVSCKNNMKEKERSEFDYFAISLDLALSI